MFLRKKNVNDHVLKIVARLSPRLIPKIWLGDLIYGAIIFRRRHGYWPNIVGNPRTFNEHIYNLRYRELLEPLRIKISDKLELKKFVAEKVGEEYNIPTLGVLSSEAELNAYRFPERCVVKPTHSSGLIYIKREGNDIPSKKMIETWFKDSYYNRSRERNYKNLEARVLIEPILDFDFSNPSDYKFFCFFGKVKLIKFDSGRFGNHERAFLSPDWEILPFTQDNRPTPDSVPRPKNLNEMIRISEILSAEFSSIRVDLYTDGDTIKVGELTNSHGGASGIFRPIKYDSILASLFSDPEVDVKELIKTGTDAI